MRWIVLLFLTTSACDTNNPPFEESHAIGLKASIGGSGWRMDQHAKEVAVVEGKNAFLTFTGFTEARAKIPKEYRDCFEKKCLIAAGEATGAHYGVSVKWSWTSRPPLPLWDVNVYDLKKGTLIISENGACTEPCGEGKAIHGWRAILERAFS